jgi:SAM-dependent methyltransferase
MSLDRHRFKLLLRRLRAVCGREVLRNAAVLSDGVGAGREALLMLTQQPRVYVGLDYDMHQLMQARVCLAQAPQVRLCSGDARALPFKDNAFDVVVMAEMLHHAADPMGCIQEALRVARTCVVIEDGKQGVVRDAANFLLVSLGCKRARENDHGRILDFHMTKEFFASLRRSCGSARVYVYPFFYYAFDVWLNRTRHTLLRELYTGFVIFLNRIAYPLGNRASVIILKQSC